ncbi:hypothetical protein I5535_15650 [Rhodobacteraceae bacterium F11138]|nr:hypothetical protein [Rhodobacteraceae bacterium F11138]
MTLAQYIQQADAAELTALATYLTGEFGMQETNPVDGTKRPAQVENVTSAFGAWAYMQLNIQDQGD